MSTSNRGGCAALGDLFGPPPVVLGSWPIRHYPGWMPLDRAWYNDYPGDISAALYAPHRPGRSDAPGRGRPRAADETPAERTARHRREWTSGEWSPWHWLAVTDGP